MPSLNRGQHGALNVSCGIAYRAAFHLAALLDLYAQIGVAQNRHGLTLLRKLVTEYQEQLDALVQAFAFGPEIQDVRPTVAELLHRMGDRKQDYRFRDEPRGLEQTAPARALALVAGDRALA